MFLIYFKVLETIYPLIHWLSKYLLSRYFVPGVYRFRYRSRLPFGYMGLQISNFLYNHLSHKYQHGSRTWQFHALPWDKYYAGQWEVLLPSFLPRNLELGPGHVALAQFHSLKWDSWSDLAFGIKSPRRLRKYPGSHSEVWGCLTCRAIPGSGGGVDIHWPLSYDSWSQGDLLFCEMFF